MTENLIIVRAGDNSVHESWALNNDWDLIVSYYGKDPNKFKSHGLRDDRIGGKLESIYELFTQRPELLNDKKFIWVTDDDIDTTVESVNNLFSIMNQYSLDIAQPSINPESFVNQKITATQKNFILRYTNYVETMTPIFSIDVFKTLLPHFKNLRFGWGFDAVWSQFTNNKMAVIDAVSVNHTRKFGTGSLYKVNQKPLIEMTKTLLKFNMKKIPAHQIFAAVLNDGSYISDTKLIKENIVDIKL